MSSQSAYRLRARDAEFRQAWASAQKMAAVDLELVLWQRAVEGVPEQVFQGGKPVGVRLKRSDALLRLLLQAADPDRYARTGPGGQTVKQIEARVRREIAAAEPDIEDVRAEVLRKVAAIERRDRQVKLSQGWTEAPDGRLLPPGWRMVRVEEDAPEEDAGEEAGLERRGQAAA